MSQPLEMFSNLDLQLYESVDPHNPLTPGGQGLRKLSPSSSELAMQQTRHKQK